MSLSVTQADGLIPLLSLQQLLGEGTPVTIGVFDSGADGLTLPITARLFAATSARDTDWMIRLADVHPDGRRRSHQQSVR